MCDVGSLCSSGSPAFQLGIFILFCSILLLIMNAVCVCVCVCVCMCVWVGVWVCV
jgi:hypothetical protein